MVKTEDVDRGLPDLRVRGEEALEEYAPAHKDFREKYFAGFNRSTETQL